VAGTGADHVMGVMAGVQHDGRNLVEIADAHPQPAGQVDGRLALVFGGMLFGVAVQDGPLGLPRRRQRHLGGVLGAGDPSPRMARSTASMATLPARAGAKAFQLEIDPLRDWRVAVVRCSAWPTAWWMVSLSRR